LLPEVLEEMKEMKDMKKMKEAKGTKEVEAMEKEGIGGSGIMSVINDVKGKSIGHGIEHAKIQRNSATLAQSETL
jgi:hypothetical protein